MKNLAKIDMDKILRTNLTATTCQQTLSVITNENNKIYVQAIGRMKERL